MKSLTGVYNKNRDQQPIKSPHAATQILIDKRNYIYVSFGSEIRIFSMRRLSKMKDFIIDVIKMQDIVAKNVELEPDSLTAKFNDPQLELIQLKQHLVQDSQCTRNKLLEAKYLKQRITHLNQQNLFIKTFQLSKGSGEHPNITVLFSTGHLVTLTNNGKGYRAVSKKARTDVRVFKYIKQNILGIVGDRLVIKHDSQEQKEINRISLYLVQVNLMQVISISENVYKIVLANFNKLSIYTIQNYKATVNQRVIQTNQPFYYVQSSCFNPNVLHLASFVSLWSIDVSEQDPQLERGDNIQDEKILLHDSITHHTTLSWKQNSITKLLIQTDNGVYVSFSYDIGRSYKELDLIMSVPNQYQILRRCIININKSLKDQKRVLNFHDLRVIQNKQINNELYKIAIMLHDTQLINCGKNECQNQANREIMDKAQQIIETLEIPPHDLKIIYQKLWIHILLISGEIMAQIIQKKLTKAEVDSKLIQKRCIFSYQKLKDDLLECYQCKLIGNKSSSKGAKRCYICWGELNLLPQM